MQKFILWLSAAVVLAGCAPKSMTHDEAMKKLNTGGHAAIYAGSYQVDTNFITGKRTIMPGRLKLTNQLGTSWFTDRDREIDTTGNNSYWGSILVPAGTYRLYEIAYYEEVSLYGTYRAKNAFQIPGEALITVAPGEVVYIGQFEAAAPSLSAILSERKLTRRDNFAKFRDELRHTNPDLAQRVAYRPLQSPIIVDAR